MVLMRIGIILLILTSIVFIPVTLCAELIDLNGLIRLRMSDQWIVEDQISQEIPDVGVMHTQFLTHQVRRSNLIICYFEPKSLVGERSGSRILINSFVGVSEKRAEHEGEVIRDKIEVEEGEVIRYSLWIDRLEGKDSYLRGFSMPWQSGSIIFHHLGYEDMPLEFFSVILKRLKLIQRAAR